MKSKPKCSKQVTAVLSGQSDQIRTIVDLLAAHFIVNDPFNPAIPLKPFVETSRTITVRLPKNSQLRLIDTPAKYEVTSEVT